MQPFFSLRRAALALAVLGLLALVGPLPAAQATPLRVTGTYVFTDTQGGETGGTMTGQSAPGGRFTGAFVQRVRHGVAQGTITLDYGHGDTLTLTYAIEFDAEVGLLVGTYEITGGTGRLEGATGSGEAIAEPGGDDDSGGFSLTGTINR